MLCLPLTIILHSNVNGVLSEGNIFSFQSMHISRKGRIKIEKLATPPVHVFTKQTEHCPFIYRIMTSEGSDSA